MSMVHKWFDPETDRIPLELMMHSGHVRQKKERKHGNSQGCCTLNGQLCSIQLQLYDRQRCVGVKDTIRDQEGSH